MKNSRGGGTQTQRIRTQAFAPFMVAMGAAMALVAPGCSSSSSGNDNADSPACVSTREYFTTEVYGKALTTCASCHTPGGQAIQAGAKFQIFRDTYPDFVTANINAMKDYAQLEIHGKPVLLIKPLGQRQHGGGAVLTADSDEYKILSKFVNDLRAGNETTCNGGAQLGVTLLSNQETARKASLLLAGRYPTDEELASVASDDGLDQLVLKLTNEELFYDLLRETWNDALLTARGLDAGVGNTYNNAPQLYDDTYPGYTPENRQWASTSVTDEPLRYIEFVVRNNLPFSDVVAGNYVVANPYTAKLYGLPHDKALAPDSVLEWKRIDFSPVQNQTNNGATKTLGVPVAGVLSTPAFLQRWETTPTNKGRKRSRIVLKNFLATDIFKFAQRPVDSTALTSVQNPTRNSAMCSVCHSVIDPIAGGFRGFDENNLTRFNPGDKWHDDLLPPGINTVQMPPDDYGSAIMWLGAQIPNDARFGIAVAQVMFRSIIGEDPLSFPQEKDAPDYADKVRAYDVQNDWFVKTGAEFTANRFDLRKLVLTLVKSEYFRAKAGDTTKDALHDGLGQGRLLTPEMLGRKYRAVTGVYFYNNTTADKNPLRARDGYLRNDLIQDADWRLVYGGIDSGDVTKRTETMSPLMVATSQYTASVVACRATSFDFTKPQALRRLFRNVELNTVPFTPRANASAPLAPVADSEPKIRQNIKELYFRLLGETVETTSEEVNDVYGLFVDTWKDLEAADLAGNGNNKGMANYRCVAQVDWDKPVTFQPDMNGNVQAVYPPLRDRADKAPYEAGMKLDKDENFTVRSWQAVITYLLMDYRFTHE
jgi:hypothetical protein